MDDDPIVRRVERAVERPGLLDALAALPGSDVTSILLALARRRAATVSPAALLRAHAENRLVRPAALDPRALLACEQHVDELLPDGYERIDLAPVMPLGAAHVLGATPQDWVVSAGRDTEVVGDPTVALALECAARRRALRPGATPVHLAAVHRALRAQPFPPPLRQHFVLAACCSAGRDKGGHAFDVAVLRDHLALYVGLAVALDVPALLLTLTPLRGGLAPDQLEELVVAPLAELFPTVRFELDAERQGGEPGYYVRTCFGLWSDEDAGAVNLADGGFTDWCARLLGDRKERLLTSGIGLERLARRRL
jgi:hypothetical protein